MKPESVSYLDTSFSLSSPRSSKVLCLFVHSVKKFFLPLRRYFIISQAICCLSKLSFFKKNFHIYLGTLFKVPLIFNHFFKGFQCQRQAPHDRLFKG